MATAPLVGSRALSSGGERIYVSPHGKGGKIPYPKDRTIWEHLTARWSLDDTTVAVAEHAGGKGEQGIKSAGGPQRTITYGQLLLKCQQVGEGLRSNLGLKPGQVVGVFGANSIDWLVIVFAIQFAALRSSLANP